MSEKQVYLPGIGLVNVDKESTITRTDVLSSDISRIIGLDTKIKNNKKIIEALKNPGEYLTKKNTELEKLQTELDNAYGAEVYRLISVGGYSNEAAQKHATKTIEAKKQARLREIEVLYPTSIEKLVIKKIKGGNKGDDGGKIEIDEK